MKTYRMLLAKLVLSFCFFGITFAQVSIAKEPAPPDWPPAWIEGAWKRGETEVSENGEASSRTFSFAEYYIFFAGHRFSVYKNRRIRATPVIGHGMQGEVNHCVLKKRTSTGARASFVRLGENLNYVSYISPSSTKQRCRLARNLEPIPDEEEFLEVLETALEREFLHIQSECSRKILEDWIRRRKQAIDPEAEN